MSPDIKVRSILVDDRCQYWPEYVKPPTSLHKLLCHLGPSTHRPITSPSATYWTHPCLTHLPNPPKHTISKYRYTLRHKTPGDIHVFIAPSKSPSIEHHTATYHVHSHDSVLYEGYTFGSTQMQALSRAVYAAVKSLDHIPDGHLIFWIRPKTIIMLTLSFNPHRDSHTTFDSRALLTKYLEKSNTNTIDFRSHKADWNGSPSRAHSATLIPTHITLPPLLPIDYDPKATMWEQIRKDYTPSDHPSHIACDIPCGGIPPPAILAAAKSGQQLISSTIFHFATGHCFDADYSDHFRPRADDPTSCPCSLKPPFTPRRHTQAHHLF